MGAAAAIIIRKQREIVDTYRAAHATMASAARDPGELGVEQTRIFDGLVRRAVLRDAGNGRYYLDEPSWVALGATRRRIALVMIVIALLLVLFALGISRVAVRPL
jgi:hypothetical protein